MFQAVSESCHFLSALYPCGECKSSIFVVFRGPPISDMPGESAGAAGSMSEFPPAKVAGGGDRIPRSLFQASGYVVLSFQSTSSF